VGYIAIRADPAAIRMRVLVTDPLAPEAVELLRKAGHEADVKKLTPEDLLKVIHEYDALLVRSETKVTKPVLEAAKRLKVVGRAGVGVDNIDVEAAKARGIRVVNSPAASTNAVAELTLGHMLALARKIPEADKSMHEGKWDKKAFQGFELGGKTLGLIGFGKIGARVTQLAKALDMHVVIYDPYVTAEKALQMGVARVENVMDIAPRADFVSVHVPLTPETKGLVGREFLSRMKKTGYVLNIARGGVVDEAALAEAVTAGTIAGAALDVFENEPLKDSPLHGIPQIHLTPHLGASTEEAQIKAGTQVVEDVLRVFRNEPPQGLVV